MHFQNGTLVLEERTRSLVKGSWKYLAYERACGKGQRALDGAGTYQLEAGWLVVLGLR